MGGHTRIAQGTYPWSILRHLFLRGPVTLGPGQYSLLWHAWKLKGWYIMCFIFVSLDVQIFHLTWTRLAAVERGREGGGWGQIFGINWVGSLLGVALIWRLPTGPATAVVMAKARLILIAAMAILTQGRSLISSDVYIMSVYYRHSKIWSFLANPCAFLFLVFSVLSNWGCQNIGQIRPKWGVDQVGKISTWSRFSSMIAY